MRLFQSKNIHDYKLILEELVEDWGYLYWRTILVWCGVIDDQPGHLNKYWQIWIVEHEGKNIGICGLWSQKEKSVDELWLGWFGLIPAMRNKKLGGDILCWMEVQAKELGCRKILSYVDKDGRPLSFYFKNGYQRTCSVGEYLKNNPHVSADNFEDSADHIIEKVLQ